MIEVAATPLPLQASLALAARRLDANEPVQGAPEGVAIAATLSVAALRDSGEGALDEAIAAAAELTGVTDRRLLATWISGWVVYWVLGPTLVAWMDERRVPPLDPDDVTVWWAGSEGACVCLGSGRWTVLPDDVLAGTPCVDVAADEMALAAVFHDRIAALLDALFRGMQAAGRVGIRQQWLQARDRIAGILQDAGRAAGREDDAIAAARTLIDRPGSPRRADRGGFERYEVAPRQLQVVYHRATCCLALRAPDGGACLTCPARPRSATPDAVLASLAAEVSATTWAACTSAGVLPLA